MILIPILCLVLGIALGLLLNNSLRGDFALYVAVACLAGLDTICGGIRSNLEGKFDSLILTTGFISNVIIAFFLSWLGDRIGADIFLACAFIFGQRIFVNLSIVRRILLTKWQDSRKRREQERAAEPQPTASN